MNIENRKKKSSLCKPSTTIMQEMGFGRRGIFAVIGGPRIGASFILERGNQCIVGSSSNTDFQLDCRGISAEHFCAFWSHDCIYIEVQQSTNGTFVHNRKVTTKTKLHSGDQIKVGATTVLKCS